MQINDSVEHVVVMLTGDPLQKRSEIDAEMGVTSRLQAGEDSGHGRNATDGGSSEERTIR